MPAKLYGVLAAARPVLFPGPRTSDTGSTVYEFICGAVVDPRDEAEPAVHVEAILREWRANPALRAEMGERGRRAFLERYEMQPCCEAWAHELGRRWPALRGDRDLLPPSQLERRDGRDGALR